MAQHIRYNYWVAAARKWSDRARPRIAIAIKRDSLMFSMISRGRRWRRTKVFEVNASNIDTYFAFDPSRENDLRAVDAMIRSAVPTWTRWFVAGTPQGEPGMRMSMIGYGRFAYKVRSSDQPVEWPILGLALQKNYLSLYLAVKYEGVTAASNWADRLGKVSVSKIGAIRFVSASNIEEQAFRTMLQTLEMDLRDERAVLAYARAQSD